MEQVSEESKVSLGTNYRAMVKRKSDPRRFQGSNVGAAAEQEHRKRAIQNVEVVKRREEVWTQLVKEGKAIREIIPILHGYKIHYRML